MQQGVVHPNPDVIYAAPPGGAKYAAKKYSFAALAHRQKSTRFLRRGCVNHRCCCLSFWGTLLTLIVLIGFLVLVFWLVVRPKSPHYTVDAVRVLGLDAKSLQSALSNNTLKSATSFVVVANNPNQHIQISYDKVNVNVDLLGVTIGQGTFPAFRQGHKNITFLSGNLTSGNVSVNIVQQQDILSANKTGKLPLDFQVDAKARMKIGSWNSPKFKISVRCKSVMIATITKGRAAPIDASCSYKIKP